MTEQRVAFVTGGAGGIGAEICRRLAAAGHRVAVADLPGSATDQIAEEIGGIAVSLNVTDAVGVEEAAAEVTSAIGAPGICVNCAGWDELKPFLDVDESFLQKVLDINLAGPMRVTKALLPAMVDNGWGRIINIASDAGRVGSSLESVYSGAKGGLISFTKTIAREMARYAITANAVCPGPTDTPLLKGIVDASSGGDKVINSMVRAVPMRRLGQPRDVAHAVVFLASEEAGYITGQTLSVSGGLTMA